MSGLEETVQFGKDFKSYTLIDDRVKVEFEDGTVVEGDLLVAADG